MSDSNRGKGVAARLASFSSFLLVLVLVAGASYWVIIWGWSQEFVYSRDADNYTNQYSANTYSPEYHRCITLPPHLQRDCKNDAENKKRDYQRDEQDLVAQKTSALWAYIMGAAAVLGVGLSSLGVWLIWTTFNATREANSIARETGQTQTRAYVHVEKYRPYAWKVGDRFYASIEIFIKNSGQSPAILHAYNIEWSCASGNPNGTISVKFDTKREIGPHAGFTIVLPIDTAINDRMTMNKIEVTLRYVYIDIYNVRAHKSVRYANYFTLEKLPADSTPEMRTPMEDGNCLGAVDLDERWLDIKRWSPPYDDEDNS